MKIAGTDPRTLPPEEVLILPRVGGNIVFKARGLPDMDEFNKLSPEPAAPCRKMADGTASADDKDPGDPAQTVQHTRQRWAYLVVKSLEPSQIEWDTVKLDEPATWTNWEADLKANGFTGVECNRIFGLMLSANSLDERKIKAARESFLAGRPEA